MRPEKSWRPIITVEVDNHHLHETVLGVDGQNPNLKEKVLLYDLSLDFSRFSYSERQILTVSKRMLDPDLIFGFGIGLRARRRRRSGTSSRLRHIH
jgi:hypothetical protein